MKIIVVADTHIGGPKQTHKDAHNLIVDINRIEAQEGILPNHVFLIGDIIDFKNTLKSNMESMRKSFDLLNLMEYVFVLGNHEGRQVGKYYHSVNLNGKNVLFEHGHRLWWEEEKANRWEMKTFKGISFPKYMAMDVAHEFDETFLRGGFKKVNEELSFRIRHYFCNNEYYLCPGLVTSVQFDVAIVGHKHPRKIVDEQVGDIRFICVKRGINIIDV